MTDFFISAYDIIDYVSNSKTRLLQKSLWWIDVNSEDIFISHGINADYVANRSSELRL